MLAGGHDAGHGHQAQPLAKDPLREPAGRGERLARRRSVLGDEIEEADPLEPPMMRGILAEREVVLLEVGVDEGLGQHRGVRVENASSMKGAAELSLPTGVFGDGAATPPGQVLALPDETEVTPGHGPVTTIGEERETNPFLHMSLHMSILEQVSINQPIGIAEAYQKLKIKHGNESDAQHDLMDCLAETIWQAQRSGQALDAVAYSARIQAKTN